MDKRGAFSWSLSCPLIQSLTHARVGSREAVHSHSVNRTRLGQTLNFWVCLFVYNMMRASLLCLSHGVAVESNRAKCVGKYAGNETALAGHKVLLFFSREAIFILSCGTQKEVIILHVIKAVGGLREARAPRPGQRTSSKTHGHVISTQPSQGHAFHTLSNHPPDSRWTL